MTEYLPGAVTSRRITFSVVSSRMRLISCFARRTLLSVGPSMSRYTWPGRKEWEREKGGG